jgi:hypothetical protein
MLRKDFAEIRQQIAVEVVKLNGIQPAIADDIQKEDVAVGAVKRDWAWPLFLRHLTLPPHE